MPLSNGEHRREVSGGLIKDHVGKKRIATKPKVRKKKLKVPKSSTNTKMRTY